MYAIVDIETTGLGAKGNKITEISIFVYDGKKIIKEFTSLVNPECLISYQITGLTGITNNMVRTAPKFYEIAKEVIAYTEDCIFVAHSVNFDYNVIKKEFEELGAEFKCKKLCTVRLSRKLIPGLKSYSLGSLCTNLGIKINGRHRARGDAEATVVLFEKLLSLDNNGTFDSFLNKGSRQATLPPLLSKKIIDNLPNETGVYYFKDVNDQIIYVGKANHIKQRVLSHIYSKANKELKLCQETANITFELTGNELTALLLESHEIKRIFPKYNRSQKRTNPSFGIATYQDRRGVMHIIFNKLSALPFPIVKFYNQTQCRNFLEELCETHELCPKYCGLQQTSGACFHFQIKKCKGICTNKEQVDQYNLRVKKVIKLIKNNDTYIIKEKGRNTDETAIILIKNGVYQGFTFIKNQHKTNTLSEYEKIIDLKQYNIDIQRIIKAYLNNNNKNNLFYF